MLINPPSILEITHAGILDWLDAISLAPALTF